MRSVVVLSASLSLASACGGWGSGTAWVQQPMTEEGPNQSGNGATGRGAPPPVQRASRTIGVPAGRGGADPTGMVDPSGGGGRTLGKFRNTYYDFPREADHTGEPVVLMSASCQPIAKVPRGFHDALCVQGSGALVRGGTVSFAKRDCPCAEICPRTNQHICYDALDPKSFPFGRGAVGKAIVPLRSVAADTAVLPMGTVIYVPELDGSPRSEAGDPHDGCFVVEDRGLRVKGEHIDIFTGHAAQTALLERHVPSNAGVTVVVGARKCSAR